jgi:hypothetical protein
MSLYEHAVPQYTKMLTNLERWLDKAIDHAKSRKFDPEVFFSARLAPDAFPLAKQVQTACDSAKGTCARLAGKEPPSHADEEKTMEDLKGRIQKCRAFIESLKPADFEGADTRLIPLFFMPGKASTGADYLIDFALANFYFHVTTAYQIMRHNGVELGKIDFIGGLRMRDA